MPTRMNALLLGVAGTSDIRAADPPRPVKVFVLAVQSNMEGQAVVDLEGKDSNDGKGTLNALFSDPPGPNSSSTSRPRWATGRFATTSGCAPRARRGRSSPGRGRWASARLTTNTPDVRERAQVTREPENRRLGVADKTGTDIRRPEEDGSTVGLALTLRGRADSDAP